MTIVGLPIRMGILNHLLHKFGMSEEPTLILSCEGEAAKSGWYANDAEAEVASCMGVQTPSTQPYKRRPQTGESQSK
jgi:hypothetical protein